MKIRSATAWPEKTRTPSPGPELALVHEALDAHTWPGSAIPFVLLEPQLPIGFPDVVAVFPTGYEAPVSSARWTLREAHVRLLHHLHSADAFCVHDLLRELLLPPRVLSNMLRDLENAQLVRLAEDSVKAEPLGSVFVAERIVAIEAKLNDWRSGLQQALRNTWFASESYLLIPDARFNHTVSSTASTYGVGVMTFDGNETEVKLPATELAIPASYGSWLLNEWLLRQRSAEGP